LNTLNVRAGYACKDGVICQHEAMRVRCPGCRAVYEVKDVDDDAILVCHRCSTEFNLEEGKDLVHDAPDPDQETSSEPASVERLARETTPDQQRVWPWLLVFLCAAIGAGLWLNKDSWMDRPWVRSFMINNGYRVIIHDRDWRLMSGSVKAQWIERTDHSLVLLIEGRVENRLQCKLPPPAMRISLLSGEPSGQIVQKILRPITLKPLGNAIRRVPFISPPEDTMPVLSSGTRGFILVLENVPDKAHTFTMNAVARQL